MGHAMVMNIQGPEVRAHVGVVALFQILVSVVTVAVTFGIFKADISHLMDWSRRHEDSQEQFVESYHQSNRQVSSAIARMEAQLEDLTREIIELRRQRVAPQSRNGIEIGP